MSLFWHLSIHILLSLVAGLIAWYIFPVPFIPFIAALVGGVLIDLDHFIDYFQAFRWRFRFTFFVRGYQFLKNDKIYILFHGWEYSILLLGAAFLEKSEIGLNAALLGLSIGSFFHLFADAVINEGMTIKAYSIFFRAWNKFSTVKLVTPEHYQKHQAENEAVGL